MALLAVLSVSLAPLMGRATVQTALDLTDVLMPEAPISGGLVLTVLALVTLIGGSAGSGARPRRRSR